MKDRNVQHASRFRLTKVPGTDDVYDLIPAPGEVYEEGTLINKSAILKDATAALFGLDDNAVPDDALEMLSRFHKGLGNEYMWLRNDGTYVNSQDPSAYPTAVSDGYTYELLGKLGGALLGVKIETGSYTGTGTYGSSNPNSLTFEFEPKIIFIFDASTGLVPTNGSFSENSAVILYPQTHYKYAGNNCPVMWNSNTLSWYSATNAMIQLNISNKVYHYIAIG